MSSLLISYANENPNSNIDTAKTVCSALRGGYVKELDDKLVRLAVKTDNLNTREALITQYAIIETIAPEYYCPDLDNS